MIHTPFFLHRSRFLRTICSGLLRRYANTFLNRYLVERRMGVLLFLDQKNAVDKHLLYRGVWEAEQIAFLTEAFKANSKEGEKTVFLDIGSHAALYSIILQSKVGLDEIFAFEPVPSNLVQLRVNLLMNGCSSKVTVVEAAVANEVGLTQFIVAADRNRGMSRILDGSLEDEELLIEVKTITIDGFRDFNNCLILAKVDVEGAEMSVLKGMHRTLRNNRCILQIERNRGDFSEMNSELESLGFHLLRSIGPDYFFSNVGD